MDSTQEGGKLLRQTPNGCDGPAAGGLYYGRVCPVHDTVVKFLKETMRSIAHGESEKVENRLVLVSAGASSEFAQQADAFPDPGLNAEQ